MHCSNSLNNTETNVFLCHVKVHKWVGQGFLGCSASQSPQSLFILFSAAMLASILTVTAWPNMSASAPAITSGFQPPARWKKAEGTKGMCHHSFKENSRELPSVMKYLLIVPQPELCHVIISTCT